MSTLARYTPRANWYNRRPSPRNVLPIAADALRRPKIDDKFRRGYADRTMDLKDKEHVDTVDAMRHPRERDYYQDHTYHEQWIQRDLQEHQKISLSGMLPHYHPGFQLSPWVWYPGDIVEVVEGEYAGMRGSIMTVVKWKNEIIVQNVNVKEINIPATETRPEQQIQREHPIGVRAVRHVDPSTDAPCDLRLITVRDPETGEPVAKRVSMQSGVLLPIPEADSISNSDPLRETPMVEAEVESYEEAKEIELLAQRKVRAMEDYFVGRLAAAFDKHEPLAAAGALEVRQYQADVVGRAEQLLVAQLRAGREMAAGGGSTVAAGDEDESLTVEAAAAARHMGPELAAVASMAAKVAIPPPEAWAEALFPAPDFEPQADDAFDEPEILGAEQPAHSPA